MWKPSELSFQPRLFGFLSRALRFEILAFGVECLRLPGEIADAPPVGASGADRVLLPAREILDVRDVTDCDLRLVPARRNRGMGIGRTSARIREILLRGSYLVERVVVSAQFVTCLRRVGEKTSQFGESNLW